MDTLRFPSLDVVIKAIPLLTGYLVFLGIASALLYYNIFDINILHYISLSEAILFSLDQFILFGGIFLVAFCILELLPEGAKARVMEVAGAREVAKRKGDPAGVQRILFRRALYGKICILVLWLATNLWHPYKRGWLLFGLLTLILAGTAFILRIFLHYICKGGTIHGPRVLLLFSLSMTTVIVLWCRTLQAVGLKYGTSTEKVIIRCKNNELYQTSDSLLYIGKVDKFLFLYNQALSEPEVIAAEEAVNIKWARP